MLRARERAVATVAANVEPIRQSTGRLEAAGELTGEALAVAIADAEVHPRRRRPTETARSQARGTRERAR